MIIMVAVMVTMVAVVVMVVMVVAMVVMVAVMVTCTFAAERLASARVDCPLSIVHLVFC